MGRETYELVTKLYPNFNFDNVEATHKIIVTSQLNYRAPNGYIAVGSPEEAKKFLEAKNVEVGLLIGGGKLNSSFYAEGLIDECWVTVNPIILGKGRPFVGNLDVDTQLKLVDVVRLDKARVQLRYSVIKG